MNLTTQSIGSKRSFGGCLGCGQDVINSLTEAISSSVPDVRVDIPSKWQVSGELVCILCRLVISVVKDANVRFGFVLDRPTSLRLLSRNQQTLIGLKLHRDPGEVASEKDVDTIFIYGTRRKDSSELCPYKKIPRNTKSLACFRTIKQWLQSCKESHQECRLSEKPCLPKRILYLGESNPRLVEHHAEEADYVALTYCWGRVSFLKTKNHTLQSHKEGIPLEQMPQNFKDAIYVSRELGYKYLWIDSLCIIQDNDEDWDEQSKLMADIYKKADLVIAATCASTAEGGFLAENRFIYREGTVPMALQDPDITTSVSYRLVPPHRNQEGPLDDRGWAFQERLLARRYLSFRSREVIWYCNSAMHCECDGAEVADAHRRYRERSLQLMFSENTAKDLHMRWRWEIVGHYTQRDLTKSKDKLRALAAIATSFQEKLGSKYLAGLWEQELILDLMWTTPYPGSYEEYNAPTWSWVAYKGWAYYLLSELNALEITTLVSSYIPDNTSEAPDIPLYGSIQLLGKLIEATLTHDPAGEVPEEGGPFVIKLFDTPELASWVVNPDIFPPPADNRRDTDTYSWIPGELKGRPYHVYILFMVMYPYASLICGIIIVKSIKYPSRYRRVGLATFLLHNTEMDIHDIVGRWDNQLVTVV